jgi:hypothetical protein
VKYHEPWSGRVRRGHARSRRLPVAGSVHPHRLQATSLLTIRTPPELAGILDADASRTIGAYALDPDLLDRHRGRYQDIVTVGTTANPAAPGNHAQTPAVNLLARLHGFATDVLRFAHDLRVPFDNSQAERDIRMVKLRQKISGCLHTFTGARIFCAIRSYLSTTRKQGINALDALTQLHNGQAWPPGTS